MSDQNIKNQLFKKGSLIDDRKVREDIDFLEQIELRINEIETGKVTGSTWEEVKAKSKI